MAWTLLKICYPIAMVPFSVSLWFVRTPVNRSYGLDREDFQSLRIICLTATCAFWILSLVSLTRRHRSFPLLWGGTIMVASALLVLPAPAATFFNGWLRAGLLAGLAAHVFLLVVNDRCLPREARNEPSA